MSLFGMDSTCLKITVSGGRAVMLYLFYFIFCLKKGTETEMDVMKKTGINSSCLHEADLQAKCNRVIIYSIRSVVIWYTNP